VRRPDGWIHGRATDTALALSWVPFAVAAHLVEAGGHSLRALFAAVMFVSFIHQPLTFPLVYGSPWRLAAHKRTFLWFPLAAVAVIALATHLSMTLVAVAGGLWNAEHILMQRYGITRLYGRMAGDDQGGVERWMLVSWFLIPLFLVTGRGELRHVLDRISSDSVDAAAAGVLARMTGAAEVGLGLAALAALYLTGRWFGQERLSAKGANAGKWLYLGSTAGMFTVAAFDPVAAVVGFVASHSIEYFVLVDRSVRSEARQPGPLGRLIRLRQGRLIFFAAYAVAATGAFVGLYRLAPASFLLTAVLAIGAVHFFYDAFIWKLRKPEVAASLTGSSPQVVGQPA
jgi:hypothetical protein